MSESRSRPPIAARLRAIERALALVAVMLLCWYGGVQLSSALYQAASTRELEQMRMPAARSGSGPPRTLIQAGGLVGRIEMPRLDVSAIVREGDDVATLRQAVGHIPGTALPGDAGNAALAGHRDTFFRGLRYVRTGDRIVVTTPDSVFHYTVRGTRVVDPADVSVLDATAQPTLTLVTCYPFRYVGSAPQRFIVTAELEQGR